MSRPVDIRQTEELAVRWTKSQPAVAAFITSLVPDFHQAEDVLHQVVVVLVRKYTEYDPKQPFEAWAVGIARLEVLKHRRKFASDKHIFDDRLTELIAEEFSQPNTELDERHHALADCLKQVKGRFMKVLQWRYFDDLSPAAIAERMEMPVGAVRTLLHRARGSLRKCIDNRLPTKGGRS